MTGIADYPASTKKHNYWAFIDGLRAVAVLSVVLYHAGLPWIPGGFVGVDIFFVISGFLIIGQIVSQMRRRTFSFSEFWSRRALRILPPYLFVILICSLIAPFILVMPNEFGAYAQEVAYSALMVVNHLFLEQQGYFDRGADTKALLHLWSLAVEEQFYIIAPLLIALMWALKARAFMAAVGLLFAASLAGCIWWTGQPGGKNYAFFLMPLRAWEFIAGGLIAAIVPVFARMPRACIEGIALAGAAAIAFSVATFSHLTPFPSYWAAVPVFGACAIILAGMSAKNLICLALQAPPMAAIGLISYSWYLWHWPMLVFVRLYRFGEHDAIIDGATVLLSAALATGTYFLVERPIRRARARHGLPLGWKPAIFGVVICAFACIVGYSTFMARSEALAASFKDGLLPTLPIGAGPCDLRTAVSPDACRAMNGSASFGILIGDSQSDAAARRLLEAAKQHNVAVLSLASGGCISFMSATTHIPDRKMAENCTKFRARGERIMAASAPSFAILYSRWTLYADPKTPYYFLDKAAARAKDQKYAFVDGFRDTVKLLRELGINRILVLGPTPTFPMSAPECVVRSLHYGQSTDARCSQPRDAEEAKRALAVAWLKEAISGDPGVRLIDPINVFCDAQFCRPYSGKTVYFTDTNHIADAGVSTILQTFKHDFLWAFLGDRD